MPHLNKGVAREEGRKAPKASRAGCTVAEVEM